MSQPSQLVPDQREVEIWDLPLRLFHWCLALLVAFSVWSGLAGGLTLKYHMWSGYGILALLVFRILWGFWGGEQARFASFMRGPRQVMQALRAMATPNPLNFTGHNPLAGWMIVTMLAALLFQVGSGLFANDDLLNEGPLYRYVGKELSDRMTGLHEINFTFLLVLIGLHVGAIVYHRLRKGEHLVQPMISGRKRLAGSVPAPRQVSLFRALVLFGASAAMVGFIVNFPWH